MLKQVMLGATQVLGETFQQEINQTPMLYVQLKHPNECSTSPYATGSSLQPHQEMLPQTQPHTIHLCLHPNQLRFNPRCWKDPTHFFTASQDLLFHLPMAKPQCKKLPQRIFPLFFNPIFFCPLPFSLHWLGSSPPHNEAPQLMGMEGAPSSHCSPQSSQKSTPLKRFLIDKKLPFAHLNNWLLIIF